MPRRRWLGGLIALGAWACSSSDGGGGTSATLGKVCDTDADCPSGLSCHLDTSDWIAHRQCSTYCDQSEECEGKWPASMCIGANLCVATCTTDGDCPSPTVCGSNGWCENTGPGSGVPKCAGTPTPCSLLTDLQCAGALGCLSTGDCSGSPGSCSFQSSSYSCSKIQGCYWSSSSSSCSGSASPCSFFLSQLSCNDQTGCYWSGGCTGTAAASCDGISANLCQYTPGCALAPQ